jgi:hypothetical protein
MSATTSSSLDPADHNSMAIFNKMLIPSNRSTFLKEYVLGATAFCASSLVISWLQILLNLYSPASVFWITIILILIISLVRGYFIRQRFLCVIGVFCAVAAVALCSLAMNFIFDTSYDGMAYHEVAIISLRSGWNPLYTAHVVDWWKASFPEAGWLSNYIACDGAWVDFYPKASWILGTTAFSIFDSLNTAKWVAPYVGILASITLYLGLVDFCISRVWASTIAAVAAFSPVVISQIGTTYVDGILSSALLIQIGAGLWWYRTNSDGSVRNEFWMFTCDKC